MTTTYPTPQQPPIKYPHPTREQQNTTTPTHLKPPPHNNNTTQHQLYQPHHQGPNTQNTQDYHNKPKPIPSIATQRIQSHHNTTQPPQTPQNLYPPPQYHIPPIQYPFEVKTTTPQEKGNPTTTIPTTTTTPPTPSTQYHGYPMDPPHSSPSSHNF